MKTQVLLEELSLHLKQAVFKEERIDTTIRDAQSLKPVSGRMSEMTPVFETDILPDLEKLNGAVNFSLLDPLGKKLVKTGQRFESDRLLQLGEDLANASRTMDIIKIKSILNEIERFFMEQMKHEH